jgi:FkbM family methyltransferase
LDRPVIVVDIGCMTYSQYPEEESTFKLLRIFHPDYYYGFDPNPDLIEGEQLIQLDDAPLCKCTFTRKAAWKHDGLLEYTLGWNPLRASTSFTTIDPEHPVPCFSLAQWLHELNEKVVLKLDCEGAEYTLIEHLERTNTMQEFVDYLLVEFHGDRERPHISVPWEEWK